MGLLRRNRAARAGSSGGAVLEPPVGEVADSLAELLAEITRLSEANRADPSRETEQRLLRARHLAGIRLLDDAARDPEFARPDLERLPAGEPLPDIAAGDVTPGLLRAGILRDGCLLVRGLVDRERAVRFASLIDRAYVERERVDAGDVGTAGLYEPFEPHARFGSVMWRPWIKEGGGLLAADSPALAAEMFEMFAQAGVDRLASGYLGEPALISVHKTTLRKAEPSVSGAWHQDGFFMGPVRSLNLWLSLSRCGDVAPGLDIVPRRLDQYLATGTEGAELNWTIADEVARQAAGEAGVIRPIFEPGDALLFDELFLHKTGSEESMPNPRYAIENWFFGGSGFPAEYAPLAV
jgi:hypothetical protein